MQVDQVDLTVRGASLAAQSTSPERLDWDCLGSLVTAELQHRRSGRQVVLTPDSSIEFAVMSALAAFQGASLLSFVAQALKVAPPPAPAPSLLNRLVRLRYCFILSRPLPAQLFPAAAAYAVLSARVPSLVGAPYM